jgi:putative hydrolase of the HAD superfamily
MIDPAQIQGIVFDLDGTLYVNEPFAATIQSTACASIADLKRIDTSDAAQLMASTRQQLCRERGVDQTLSAVYIELGGTIEQLYRHFQEKLRPEAFLQRDDRVIALLQKLSQQYSLYIYTNNNRPLTQRIINHLGLDGLFKRLFTIDDSWQAKPDQQMLVRVLNQIALEPGQVLFVGDRFDVDLRLPEQYGCPVQLCQSVEQLLELESLLFRQQLCKNNPLLLNENIC